MKKLVNTPWALPHYPYAALYFNYSQSLIITDCTDVCTAETAANAIGLLDSVEAAWNIWTEKKQIKRTTYVFEDSYTRFTNFLT